MRALYSDSLGNFFKLRQNEFIEIMEMNASIGISPSEISSWKHNFIALTSLLNDAKIPNSVSILFEYRLPIGGRIDCILCGKDKEGKNNIIIIELKQWTKANKITGTDLLEVYTGGSVKEVLHPIDQANDYKLHLENHFQFLKDLDINVYGTAFCFNYQKEKTLGKDSLFDQDLRLIRNLYCTDNRDDFIEFLKQCLSGGEGDNIKKKLLCDQPFPSDSLLQAAANIVFDDNKFILLGDQHIALKKIKKTLSNTLESNNKSVVIIKGGPGTGKTVIALKLLSYASQKGYSGLFATRSTALRDELRNTLKKDERAGDLIRNIFEFRPAMYKEGQLDLLVIDEAHRIQKSANDQTDGNFLVQVKTENVQTSVYCPLPQVISLIYCAKVTIFLIDDRQSVKKQEIGKTREIIEAAQNYSEIIKSTMRDFKLHEERANFKREKDITKIQEEILRCESEEIRNKLAKKLTSKYREISHINGLNVISNLYKAPLEITTIELKTQFRCEAADEYVNWLDEILFNPPSKVEIRLKKGDYDFRIYSNPRNLYEDIKIRNAKNPNRPSRLLAGWCWPWSNDQVDPETLDLKHEIIIGDDFSAPWETKKRPPLNSKYRDYYAPNINTFASHPKGVNQVGCIYTAQGFEFEYVGVIIGPDLQYDEKNDCLKCLPENNMERNISGEDAEEFIRNIYRVLMTRGRKGCYLYCCDHKLSEYFRRFLNHPEHFSYD